MILIFAALSLSFSIPECKVVQEAPPKDRDFAFIVPGQPQTYIYEEEADYYKGYQRSYFAVTCKKGGWDCLRHYEILANGCIPYFLDLDQCDPRTMAFLPRELILEAMHLEGVSYLHIDHTKFDRAKYDAILEKLLAYTRSTLTTKAMAEYVLKEMGYQGGKILYLSERWLYADYLCDLMLIGLKEALGNENVIDIPKIDFLYKSYGKNIRDLYGKGMSYTKILPDSPLDRSDIEQRIREKEFAFIIYGSIHREKPFWDTVHAYYPQEQIFYFCGDDAHTCEYLHYPNLFLREW